MLSTMLGMSGRSLPAFSSPSVRNFRISSSPAMRTFFSCSSCCCKSAVTDVTSCTAFLSPAVRAADSRSRSAAMRSNSDCVLLTSSTSPAALAFDSSSSRLRVRASVSLTRFSRSWDKLFARASVNSLISSRSVLALLSPSSRASAHLSSPLTLSVNSSLSSLLRACNSVFMAPSAFPNSLSTFSRSVVSRSSSFLTATISLLPTSSAWRARSSTNFSSSDLSPNWRASTWPSRCLTDCRKAKSVSRTRVSIMEHCSFMKVELL
mmetsp:Transcript_78927/g.148927  ORF Transcript_78927/g.148927 Transcript_78927/m.148927 type:complete len:264 (-) Transcript_78927:205-996(-)